MNIWDKAPVEQSSGDLSFARLKEELWDGWWIVAVSAVVAGCLACLVSLSATPVYESSATLYVTSGTDDNRADMAYTGSLASQQRVASYAKLATSDAVVTRALGASGLGMTANEAREAVSASATPETVLLTVTAKNSDPATAQTLVNAIADSLVAYTSGLETPTGGSVPLAKLTKVSAGLIPSGPVSPRYKRNSVLGTLIGVVVGFALLLIRSRLNNRIKDRAAMERYSGSNVLTEIPLSSSLGDGDVVNFSGGSSRVAEAFRLLRSNLSYVNVDKPPRIMMITSSVENEGKTTVSTNLAVAYAEAGHRVALVGADLRRPTLRHWLSVNESIGLTNVLRGDATLAEVTQPSGYEGLDVVPAGTNPPNPTELLESERTQRVLNLLAESYDYVIIDSPPVLLVADSVVLCRWIEGVILVARVNVTRATAMSQVVRQLERANAKLIGVAMNGVATSAGTYGYAPYEASA